MEVKKVIKNKNSHQSDTRVQKSPSLTLTYGCFCLYWPLLELMVSGCSCFSPYHQAHAYLTWVTNVDSVINIKPSPFCF